MRKVKKWEMLNGNRCFSLAMREFFENMWVVLFMSIVGFIDCGLEFWISGTCVLLIPIGVLLFVFLLWCLEGGVPDCARMQIDWGNSQGRCKINSERLPRFIDGLKLSAKTRLWLVLGIRFVVGALIFARYWWLLDVCIKMLYRLIVILFVYAVAYILIGLLCAKRSSRILNVMKIVISMPWEVFYSLFYAVLPFSVVAGTCLFLVTFTFGLPAFLLVGLDRLGWLMLQKETIIFVVFTLGSIVCSHFYRFTKGIIYFTPLRGWGNHAYASYRVQLAIYLIRPGNVVFLLYLLYFVLLGISGYLQMENGDYLFSQGIDAAILKAFLVFIAFTNMRVKAKDAEFDVRELYQRTLKLFEHDA